MPAAKPVLIAACLAGVIHANVAGAQTITTEASTSAGVSSDEVSALAMQLRAFGEVRFGFRYFVEAAWGGSSDDDSDAFGAAYPYGNRVQIIEAYGERLFRPKQTLIGVRAGRYRPPFGISNASDHAYTGFLRAPLIRYDGYFGLSNTFLEHGADLIVGVPRLTVETSLGAPADVGTVERRPGLDTVVRLQSYAGQFIAGASYIRTLPYMPETSAHGRLEFAGLDLRWMRDGVQLRGEWLTGRPFDGTSTSGWYADAIVHRVAMGPITAVARVERLDYDTVPQFAFAIRRQTIGARIRLTDGISAQVNVLHQTGRLEEYRPTAIDVGVTYSIRHR